MGIAFWYAFCWALESHRVRLSSSVREFRVIRPRFYSEFYQNAFPEQLWVERVERVGRHPSTVPLNSGESLCAMIRRSNGELVNDAVLILG